MSKTLILTVILLVVSSIRLSAIGFRTDSTVTVSVSGTSIIVVSKFNTSDQLVLQVRYQRAYGQDEWVFSDKNEFAYNSLGKQTSQVVYTWDNIHSLWMNSIKYTWHYDPQGNVLLYESFQWNTDLFKWVSTRKMDYLYSEEKQVKTYTSIWNPGLSAWENQSFDSTVYDNDLTTEKLYFSWNSSTSSWVDNVWYTYTFDEKGRLSSYFFTKWETATLSWVNQNRGEYTYDGDNKKTSVLIYFKWDNTLSTWKNNFMHEFTFNADGAEILSIQSMWDNVNSKWNYAEKREKVYDDEGNQLTAFIYKWDINKQVWNYSKKAENTYNETGIKTKSVNFSWTDDKWNAVDTVFYYNVLYSLDIAEDAVIVAAESNSNGIFHVSSTVSWVMDINQNWLTADQENGSGDEVITLTVEANQMEGARVASIILTGDKGLSDTIIITQSGRSPQSGINHSDNPLNITFFPNPTKGMIRVSLNEKFNTSYQVDVFDQAGALMLAKAKPAPETSFTLNLEEYPSGIYFLYIHNAERRYYVKILKE